MGGCERLGTEVCPQFSCEARTALKNIYIQTTKTPLNYKKKELQFGFIIVFKFSQDNILHLLFACAGMATHTLTLGPRPLLSFLLGLLSHHLKTISCKLNALVSQIHQG